MLLGRAVLPASPWPGHVRAWLCSPWLIQPLSGPEGRSGSNGESSFTTAKRTQRFIMWYAIIHVYGQKYHIVDMWWGPETDGYSYAVSRVETVFGPVFSRGKLVIMVENTDKRSCTFYCSSQKWNNI